MSAFILCISLEESDVTVTPSVTSVNWICWWCSPMAHLFFCSTALAFVPNVSEKCKSTSPSAIQIKNLWKTVGIEGKLRHNKLTWKRWTNCWHMP